MPDLPVTDNPPPVDPKPARLGVATAPADAISTPKADTSVELQVAALTLHAALCKVIAPATITTLHATSPMNSWADLLKLPKIVLFAGVAALASLSGFIKTTTPVTLKPSEKKGESSNDTQQETSANSPTRPSNSSVKATATPGPKTESKPGPATAPVQ